MKRAEYPKGHTPYDLDWFLARATTEAIKGRVAVRKLMEEYRATFKRPLNNNVAPHIAREIQAQLPQLADMVETRALGTRGKNKAPAGWTIKTALDDLKAAARALGLEVDAVTMRQVTTGEVRTFPVPG